MPCFLNSRLFVFAMYQNPAILHPAAHAQWRFTDLQTYAHTAALTRVPLVHEELPLVAAQGVIVFEADSAAPQPLALLGLEAHNRCLDPQHRWATPYVPAAVRRYPFALGQDDKHPDQWHLCIDTAAPHFSPTQGQALFNEQQQPTELAQRAMTLVTTHHQAQARTVALYQALADAGVIRPKVVSLIDTQTRTTHAIGGFAVVDEALVYALPDATLAAWARNGLLAGIHHHWASLRHLEALVAAEAAAQQAHTH